MNRFYIVKVYDKHPALGGKFLGYVGYSGWIQKMPEIFPSRRYARGVKTAFKFLQSLNYLKHQVVHIVEITDDLSERDLRQRIIS